MIFGQKLNYRKLPGEAEMRTGHEGPEGEYRYSYTHPWTSAIDGEGVLKPSFSPFDKPEICD